MKNKSIHTYHTNFLKTYTHNIIKKQSQLKKG